MRLSTLARMTNIEVMGDVRNRTAAFEADRIVIDLEHGRPPALLGFIQATGAF